MYACSNSEERKAMNLKNEVVIGKVWGKEGRNGVIMISNIKERRFKNSLKYYDHRFQVVIQSYNNKTTMIH